MQFLLKHLKCLIMVLSSKNTIVKERRFCRSFFFILLDKSIPICYNKIMYNYERLSDEIKLAVSSDHTFGTDAVILSHFAPASGSNSPISWSGIRNSPFTLRRETSPYENGAPAVPHRNRKAALYLRRRSGTVSRANHAERHCQKRGRRAGLSPFLPHPQRHTGHGGG